MNIRLYNARILTMEPGQEIFRGEVWVKDDRIAMVAEDAQLAQNADLYAREKSDTNVNKIDKGKDAEEETAGDPVRLPIRWDEEIDCGGDLLMPGLKNAHTHSAMTFLRSLADDKPTQAWLAEDIFPNEEKLTDGDIYDFARLAILEYVSGGTTAIFDMYLRPEVVAQVCADSGMRCVLVSGLNNFTSSIEQTADEFKRLNRFHPLISYRLGFHAEYTCSRKLLEDLAALAHRFRAPVYCHLAETRREAEECRERNKLAPLEYLNLLELFKYGGGGFHCVWLNDLELEILKMRRMSVVTNPASNLKLASGIAPLAEFLRRGICVGIGTDGAASNNALDLFREMYLASVCAKLSAVDASALDASEVLSMATAGSAEAMGLADADTLTRGKLADLVLLNLHTPNMQPEHNIPKNIVYAANKGNVRMTMIGGKVVYRDGAYFVGEEPERIYAKCRERSERIFGAV